MENIHLVVEKVVETEKAVADFLLDWKMEDNLNSSLEDNTHCSVVVPKDSVSLLGFPLDIAALQSMVVEVRSQIHVDFPQFRAVK